MNSSPQALETFYPRLARTRDVKAAFKSEFGTRAAGLLKKMTAGQSLESDAAAVGDLIDDLVQNGCTEDETFYGRGSCGFFPITICSFGPVSFIRASEFDDIGYFGNTKDARFHAENEYEPFGPFVDDPDAEDEEDYDEESTNE